MHDKELEASIRSIASKPDAEKTLAMIIIRLNQVAKIYGDEDPITIKIYAIKETIIDYFDREGYVLERHNDTQWCVSVHFDVHGVKFKLHRMFWGKRTPGRFTKRSLLVLAKGVREWDEDRDALIAVAIKIMEKLSIKNPIFSI